MKLKDDHHHFMYKGDLVPFWTLIDFHTNKPFFNKNHLYTHLSMYSSFSYFFNIKTLD
jgi:hypothetical protein